MHLSINKKKIYFYITCLFLLTSIFNIDKFNFFKNIFLIDKINIKTNFIEINQDILNETKYLLNKNILLINKNELLENLEKLSFLENINIKINYPSTIIIEAKKTKFLGITYINKSKYFVGDNKKFILSNLIKYDEKLPIIFGNFVPYDYLILLNKLKQKNINIHEIKNFYFHKNKRWDLDFYNNISLKLPNKNIDNSIKLFKKLQNSNQFNSYTVFDLRVSNRIILTNEQ